MDEIFAQGILDTLTFDTSSLNIEYIKKQLSYNYVQHT